jgi:hypothetical protein
MRVRPLFTPVVAGGGSGDRADTSARSFSSIRISSEARAVRTWSMLRAPKSGP